MLRSPSLLSISSCCVCLFASALASAQTEGAPLPEPPAPPPADVAPSAEPSTEPAPPTDAAPPAPPPSAEPVPPSAPAAPATDAFPLPPSTTPAPAPAPAPRQAPPPPPAREVEAPQDERRPKPSEGLFQSSEPSAVHHVQDREKENGVDQFKIGPVVGVGVPSVISVGGTLKVTRFLGAGVNLGLIPKVQLSYYGDATLSYQHVDVYGRLYPFGGGFFLHGGLGYANVNGTLTGTERYSQANGSGRVDYEGVGKVHTPTLTALIGYFYTTSIGFSFGVDAGAQIPIAPSTIEFNSSHTLTTTPAAVAPLLAPQADAYAEKADQAVRDTLEKLGRTTIPTVNLRIGWIL